MIHKGLSNFNVQGLRIGAAITLVLVAVAFFIWFIWNLNLQATDTAKITAIIAGVGILNFLVFLGVAAGGWWQLKTIREQNRTIHEQNGLSRIVQWKNSLLNVNDSILEHPDPFLKVLYPTPQSVDDMKLSIAAFSILNALETVYYMRKNIDKENLDDIREFLEIYISHQGPIRELWKNETNHSAFTSEFQTEITNILKKSNKSPSTSPPAADTRDGRSESRVSD